MFIGALRHSRLPVVLGQLVVSAHIFMYLFASGWNWLIGIACLAMFIGAVVYKTEKDGPWLTLWILFTLPSAAAYALFMGIWVTYVIARGP